MNGRPYGKTLYDADKGRVSEVSSLLRDHPEINVNFAANTEWTPLHASSFHDHVEVVKLLLAHPNINVNVKSTSGLTPLSLCCESGHVGVVRLLLKDPRVDVTSDDNNGCTPLWHASYWGNHEIIESLIASGRDLGDVKSKKVSVAGKDYTALEIARESQKIEVVALLERFMANPTQTRHEVRVKLGAGCAGC